MSPVQCFRSAIRRTVLHVASSKYAALWFAFVFIHCAIQVGLQVTIFVDRYNAQKMVDSLLEDVRDPIVIAVILDNALQECDGIPYHASTTCLPLSNDSGTLVNRSGILDPVVYDARQLNLSPMCLNSLSWLENIFRDAMAENVVTLFFQVWLFAVAILTIMHNSIAHLIVCVTSQLLFTVWAGTKIQHTLNVRAEYNRFIVHGSCGGTDILGIWWDWTLSHVIVSAVCNAVAVPFALLLAWKLFQGFAKESFSYVGASPVIERAYKLSLCFEANLELAVFFGLSYGGLWVNQLFTDPIHRVLKLPPMWQSAFTVLLLTLPVWALTGVVSIRRETKWLFSCFALLSVLLIASSVTIFASALYQFEFVTWLFFACLSIMTFVLLLSTTAVGIVCRLNFGKGLAHFLQVKVALGHEDFPPTYFANDPTVGADVEIDVSTLKREHLQRMEALKECHADWYKNMVALAISQRTNGDGSDGKHAGSTDDYSEITILPVRSSPALVSPVDNTTCLRKLHTSIETQLSISSFGPASVFLASRSKIASAKACLIGM